MQGDPARHFRAKMDSYIRENRKWSLIKLHGSIDWGRKVEHDVEYLPFEGVLASTFARLGHELRLDDEIVLRTSPGIRERRIGADNVLYYPALSAPLGERDEIVCPQQHLEHLRTRLGHWETLDVLVIGYSGLDQEVLGLLREPGRPIRSLTVVNGSEGAGVDAAMKIQAAVSVEERFDGTGESIECWDLGFDEFVRQGLLDTYVRKIQALSEFH